MDRMKRYPLIVLSLFVIMPASASEPWTTFRANPQRTGCGDGKAGPTKPAVLWVHKSKDHYVAAPVAFGERLLLSAVGGLNNGELLALDTNPSAANRVAWTKGQPLLKLPTVSSPAVGDGLLLFGDGMHQTDGATLYCVTADKGQTVWQYPMPGNLVHLEGTPTVADGKAYFGGGAGGVVCVDVKRVTLDGKEMDIPAVQKILDAKWKELEAKYQEAKQKKDPFAQPPSEDQLPKPSPVKLWQQGDKKWHVDAAVAVVDNKVLVASSYLDKEKVGDRALYCLDASNGKELWRAALTINPWAGPSVQGKTVVIAGSSIAYDPKLLKGAKGEVVAINLDDGKEIWRKPIKGGVLGSVALTKDAAICTATDGKVRAYDLAKGEQRWIYDAVNPIFAAPAVAGDLVYVGDLKGVIHAINLGDGTANWTMDLATQAEVKMPGMIYGGPAVQGGKLYVATCNLAGEYQGQPTAVVCIGDK